VTSSDGHDIILDFEWGTDALALKGLTNISKTSFEALFNLTQESDGLKLATEGGDFSVLMRGVTMANLGADASNVESLFYDYALTNGWFI
jgi:hypothetical protein